MKLSKVALIGLLFVVARVDSRDALPAADDSPVIQIQSFEDEAAKAQGDAAVAVEGAVAAEQETNIKGSSTKVSKGEVAGATAILAGATHDQVVELEKDIDVNGESVTTASGKAGLTDAQSVPVISMVIAEKDATANNFESHTPIADVADALGVSQDQVADALSDVTQGQVAAAAAVQAGATDDQAAQIA
ncbi:hypothetical protein As57867_006123, partial [Aphanomyces stellatus]